MLQIFKNIEINENIGTTKLKSELFTPAGNCMFKVNNRNTPEQGMKYFKS